MLISKGFKTYLLMRRNFPLSFPNEHGEMPDEFKKVASGFYRHKFGSAYSAESDLIRFEESHGAVRGRIAVPSDADLLDSSIRFFTQRNPDFQQGVELACIAEIRFSDFAHHIRKYFIPRKATGTPRGDGIARGEILLPRTWRKRLWSPASDQRHLERRR
jgi:hypothetical protein